jgi:uncharacterized protein
LRNEGLSILISADSHVMEPPDLWANRLPTSMRDRAPRFGPHAVGQLFQGHDGGWDGARRTQEMRTDGVHAEILYPTLANHLFALDDVELQEACFRVYNDYLIEYCANAPDQLVGLAAISAYRPSVAVAEMRRCREAGLRGFTLWVRPHKNLLFSSVHYEPIWNVAEELGMPLGMHADTGWSDSAYIGGVSIRSLDATEWCRFSVNRRIYDASNVLFDLIFSGVLELHPKLKVVFAELEVGWLPFYLQQWDYYYQRARNKLPGAAPIQRLPSDYFRRQVYACFFRDAIGASALAEWGASNFLWSNDFPHPNSTWPRSKEILGGYFEKVPTDVVTQLVHTNAAHLYQIEVRS